MFWIWTLFFEEGGRLERDSIVISSFDHLPMGKGGFSVAEMPCDIISLVKVPGKEESSMDRGCELVVEAAPSNGFLDPCHS